MKQLKNNRLLTTCGLLTIVSVILLSTSLQGDEKHYEISPEITVPRSKTDTERVIDAYERLMDNYMRLMDNNLTGLRIEIAEISQKVDSLDQKMSRLSEQLNAVQKKLGIPLEKSVETKSPDSTDKANLKYPK
jgi:uncharacterized coiled-coil protein SlyX